jgi:hypothetical protein
MQPIQLGKPKFSPLMYDSSLDQFTKTDWVVPKEFPTYNSNYIENRNRFGI